MSMHNRLLASFTTHFQQWTAGRYVLVSDSRLGDDAEHLHTRIEYIESGAFLNSRAASQGHWMLW
jgi:hypothetical protein